MPTVYAVAILAFFVVGSAVGGWCGYQIGRTRIDPALRENIDQAIDLLQRRVETVEQAISVAAEAERILRQHNNDKDGAP